MANEKVIITNIAFVMVGKAEPLVRVLHMVSWGVFENNVFSRFVLLGKVNSEASGGSAQCPA